MAMLCKLKFEEILSRFVHPPACSRGTGQLQGNLGSRPCPQPFADEGSLFGGGACTRFRWSSPRRASFLMLPLILVA